VPLVGRTDSWMWWAAQYRQTSSSDPPKATPLGICQATNTAAIDDTGECDDTQMDISDSRMLMWLCRALDLLIHHLGHRKPLQPHPRARCKTESSSRKETASTPSSSRASTAGTKSSKLKDCYFLTPTRGLDLDSATAKHAV
jgi:hypothetical protein